MNRGKFRPFAKGSEGNLMTATAVAALVALVHQLQKNAVTRALLTITGAVWLVILYFFRDPDLNTLNEDGLVVCPGDGKVVEISAEHESKYLDRDVIRVSIFLSLFDVHVQRVPISGRVTLIHHQPGLFKQAFRPEASEVNEYIAMSIDTDRFGPVLVKQISGLLARRCVNHQRVGDQVTSGERFGLIRFGSRVDLFFSPEAQILVDVGDTVYGGISPIARLEESPA